MATVRSASVTAAYHPPMELTARSEFYAQPVPRLWVPRPHFAVGLSSALWFSQTRRCRTLFQTSEPDSLRVPSSSGVFPVAPSRPDRQDGPPTTLLGFCSLQHIRGSGVHLPRACLTRYVPPSGFGYPLDGLLPPGPRRPCFVPTALLGFLPSKRSPLERCRGCYHPRRTHLPFLLPLLPRTNPRVGPASSGFWSLTLPRVPGHQRRG